MEHLLPFEVFFREDLLPLLEGLDTPSALGVAILARYGEWDQVANLRFNPHRYAFLPPVVRDKLCKKRAWRSSHPTLLNWNVDYVKREYQAIDLVRKCKDLPIKADLEEKARATFFECEAACFRANRRMIPMHPNALVDDEDALVHPLTRDFHERVKKEIKRVLGSIPHSLEHCAFGPGSVFEVVLQKKRIKDLTVLDKLDRLQPAVTRDAIAIFKFEYYRTLWGGDERAWADPILVPGNRFATVEKDATKRRAIGVEPGGNLFLQKGIGTVIKRKLQRHYGLLLAEGLSERSHHRLAQQASKSGEFATVDLSNASDTIGKDVVRALLPEEWFDLLDSVRSKRTLVDGRWITLEKFSSMGNAATFELETLVFAALARVTTELCGEIPDWVSVYGDDIIVPTRAVQSLLSILRFYGFTPNVNKTFVSGHFRESCGGDFYAGVDIAPTRVKAIPITFPDWISYLNGISRRWDREVPGDPTHRAWHGTYYRHITREERKYQCPSQYGDIGIHWRNPRGLWCQEGQRFKYRVLRLRSRHINMARYSGNAVLCYALLGGDPEGPIPRGSSGVIVYTPSMI